MLRCNSKCVYGADLRETGCRVYLRGTAALTGFGARRTENAERSTPNGEAPADGAEVDGHSAGAAAAGAPRVAGARHPEVHLRLHAGMDSR